MKTNELAMFKPGKNDAIISLYTELANNPEKDFGWAKGVENARYHNYQQIWFDALPKSIWDSSAAVANPFSLGEINAGDTVLDLGCGSGVDLCVAGLMVGAQGRLIGVDITPSMLKCAQTNLTLSGYNNFNLINGSIEQLPLPSNSIDVVMSNGVINLTESKERVFDEIYRVMRPTGAFYLADMIRQQEVCMNEVCGDESWADCVSGTLTSERLLAMMQAAGFSEVELVGHSGYKTSDITIGACFRAFKKA